MRITYTFRYLFYIVIFGTLLFLYKYIRVIKSSLSSENVTKSIRVQRTTFNVVQNYSKIMKPKLDTKVEIRNSFLISSSSTKLQNYHHHLTTTTLMTGSAESNRPAALTLKNEKVKNEEENLKYILLWTSPRNVPFVYLGKGREVFKKRSCKYTNCYVTSDRKHLGDYTKFDVIAFAGPEVAFMSYESLPILRLPHQKYAFASIESSDYYPICNVIYNRFFNWTWTFRLDSDTRWGYLVIRNDKGDIIGPNKIMHWIPRKDMKPISKDLEAKLKRKSIAAAWFVSNCDTRSQREKLAEKLRQQLKKYNLELDIYGRCGSLVCDRENETKCDELIKEKYFFYLAFENSFNKDYVTEKVLHALRNSAIPIVYGGANYSRFLPDGSYLNARTLTIEALAAKMYELIQDFTKYSEYFKWKNHYSYHKRNDATETDDYCGICALLNDEKKVKENSVYRKFIHWWNESKFKCYFSRYKSLK